MGAVGAVGAALMGAAVAFTGALPIPFPESEYAKKVCSKCLDPRAVPPHN